MGNLLVEQSSDLEHIVPNKLLDQLEKGLEKCPKITNKEISNEH